MKLQVIKNQVLYWLKSIVLYGLYLFVLLTISSFFILQIPAVQTRLAKTLLGNFSEVTGFKTTISRIEFYWFDRIIIERLTVTDPENNTMFDLRELQVNFQFSEILEENNPGIDAAIIDSAHVYFTRINETDTTRNLNINVFINRLNQTRGKSSGGAGQFTIGEAILKNSTFVYRTDRDSIQNGFDYNHFKLRVSDAELQNFKAVRDTVQFDVASLRVTDEKTKFTVHRLSSFFRISQKSMEFKGLILEAGRSSISDTIIFNYNSQLDLGDFTNRVSIYAHFNKTLIHPRDLALFAPQTEKISRAISLNGHAVGKVNQFRFHDMDLEMGSTHLRGSLEMDGLPDLNETFIMLSLKHSQITLTDFDFLFKESTLNRLAPLGTLSASGQFLGYPTDFVANGEFQGQLGQISSDINFKVNEKSFDRSVYKGKLVLSDFELGRYLNDTILFQRVNMDGQINGSGLTGTTADFVLDGKINSIGIKGYRFSNIETNARFASQLFNGQLTINDPNLELQVSGSIDLRKGINRIKLQGSLDTLNLDQIGVIREPLFLQTKLDVDLQGFVLDSLRGSAHLQDLRLLYDDELLYLDSVNLTAVREKEQRLLRLETSLVNAEAKGDFYFSNLFLDIQDLLHEFYLNIKNDKRNISAYYRNKTNEPVEYEANFQVLLKNIKPIAEVVDLDLSLSPNTLIEGNYFAGQTTIIQAFTRFDSLQFGLNKFYKSEIEVNASKASDSTLALAMVYVHSKGQILENNLRTKDLTCEAIWDRTHVDVDLSLSQQNMDNSINLDGTIDFLDSTYIRFLPSSIKLLDKNWTVDSANTIAVSGKEWSIRNLNFSHQEQSIGLSGRISPDSTKKLSLLVTDFDLAAINPLIQRKLAGLANADVVLMNFYGVYNFENTVSIDQLKVDDFLIGNITGNNIWDPRARKFLIEFFIDRLDNRIVNCRGNYDPFDKESPLNITATFTQANLKIFEPFIDEIFSQFEGTLTGAYTITGTPNAPKLNGSGSVENGALLVNYLRTVYHFNGILGLTPGSIFFKEITLTDAYRNRATLNGAILHRNFKSMEIDLDGRFTDFQVLNTTVKDNSLFYGQGYASGTMKISGPLNNLKISADARTRRNTRIYIPVTTSSSADQKDFINFVSFSDSTYLAAQQVDVNRKVSLTGITIDFNLEVTPDAYSEIIFDLKAGDIIRGRGNGKIKLQLDTKGDFNMFGPFEFTEGWYNFTLYDIINKEFQIKPGSRITWYGDPYQAALSIDASYNQMASLAPILNDPTLSNVTQIKRKYPVQVLLKLDGQMLSPQITFDINAKDLPKSIQVEGRPPVALDLEFYSFKNKLDEQELKRQVFSLIILRRFSPLESGIDMSGSVANSVSELLSNQLSNWMSQVDENLEIDVDLGTMDQEAFNTFQLRLSYTFLNGRLRVTGDGTFNNQTSSQTSGTNSQSNLSSIAGDWTVDYLLTPDGKFKVKMYSRTNANPLVNTINSQNTLTTGVSLMHTQSFNEIKDLLRSSREKNRREKTEEESRNDEATKEDEGDN